MNGFGLLVLAIAIAALGWWVPDLIVGMASVIMYTMAISQALTGILIFMG